MYRGILTKLENVRPHPNADKLKLATVFDTQIVVGLEAKNGDVGVYFPSDGQLSHEYLMANKLYRKDPLTGEKMGGYFDGNGRVRIQKFRGELSDGIFLSLASFTYTGITETQLLAFGLGYQFDELNGHHICNKYVRQSTNRLYSQKSGRPSKEEEFLYPYFNEVGETQKLKYYIDSIREGAFVVITEKLHGTSNRTAYTLRVNNPEYQRKRGLWEWVKSLARYFVMVEDYEQEQGEDYVYVSGTRRTVLPNKNIDGSDAYRRQAHNLFLNKLHKGETVYYEIVGYDSTGGTIMARHSTTKFPEIQQIYGDIVTYSYGCQPGEHEIYIYRITQAGPDGNIVELPWNQVLRRAKELNVKTVPELFKFCWRDSDTDFCKGLVKSLSEGPSVLDSTHPREGVCVRIDDKVFKWKGDTFCLLEDIAKEEETYVDIEEDQEQEFNHEEYQAEVSEPINWGP